MTLLYLNSPPAPNDLVLSATPPPPPPLLLLLMTGPLPLLPALSHAHASSGHKLVDWRPTFAGGRVAGTPAPPAAQKITPGSGGGGGGGGGGNRKSRGGGTPTRPKGSKGKAAAAAAGAGEGVGEGRNASVAGRKGGRGGAAAAGDDTSEGNAEVGLVLDFCVLLRYERCLGLRSVGTANLLVAAEGSTW